MTNAIDIVGPGEGKLRLTTEMLNNKFTFSIGVNAQATFGPHCPGLDTAINLLRSNYVGIVIEEEAGNTSYIMTFDGKPE